MSLLKKIEAEVDSSDREILQILDVAKSTDEMLAELQKTGKIDLETNPTSNEDKDVREDK